MGVHNVHCRQLASVTWISHSIDAELFGVSPAGHHLTSIVLHAVNVALLFFLLQKATGSSGRSVIVALLFALHPLNVESVAWVAERKTLLSTLFFFLALGCYGWYTKRPSAARYGALALLFALGLMAKPMVITLPFVLMLLDYWSLDRIRTYSAACKVGMPQRTFTALFVEKLPLLALSAGSAVITLVTQSRADAIMPLSAVSVWLRIENAIYSYALYLRKAIWPTGLAIPYPELTPKLWLVLGALVVLSGISLWVWRGRRKRPYLVTGWLWYLGTLVPVIGIVQVGAQGMADRYAYIPMIGVFVMLVWSLADTADSCAFGFRWRVGGATVVLLVLAAVTDRQIGFWQSPLPLWTHTLQVTRSNFIAEDKVASALMDLGRNDEAILHFSSAIRLKPTEPIAYIVLGALLRDRDPRMAIDRSQAALTLTHSPQQLLAIYINLGMASSNIGDYEAASKSFQQALRIEPSDRVAMMGLGSVSLRQAAGRMEHELQQYPSADGFSQLGSLWEQAADVEQARRAYRMALAIDPRLSSAKDALDRLQKH